MASYLALAASAMYRCGCMYPTITACSNISPESVDIISSKAGHMFLYHQFSSSFLFATSDEIPAKI
eukprot:158808-Ditylum_brightwellii.AAC.1